MGESSVLYADLILLKSILLCFTPLLPAPPKNQSTLAVCCILLVYLKIFSIILILIQERHITNLFHMFLGQGKNNSSFAHKLARQKSSSPLHVLAFLLYSLILHPSSPLSTPPFSITAISVHWVTQGISNHNFSFNMLAALSSRE